MSRPLTAHQPYLGLSTFRRPDYSEPMRSPASDNGDLVVSGDSIPGLSTKPCPYSDCTALILPE